MRKGLNSLLLERRLLIVRMMAKDRAKHAMPARRDVRDGSVPNWGARDCPVAAPAIKRMIGKM